MEKYLSDIIILIGAYFFYLSFVSNKHTKVVRFQIIAVLLFNVGVLLLNVISNLSIILFLYSSIVLIISLTEYNYLRKFLSLFGPIIGILLSFFMQLKFDSELIIIGSIFSNFALYSKNIFHMKIWYLFSNISYIIFDIYISSIPAILFDIFGFAGLLIFFCKKLEKKILF